MPTLTFTNGNDSYVVRAAGTYDLSFLAGDDTLVVDGGTLTTASMGDGNDVVDLRSGDAQVFGDLGNDRFEIRASDIVADGGAGSDLFNLRGGANVTLNGGLGADRFNFYAGAIGVFLQGGAGDDDFFGYGKAISGNVYGGSNNDYFVGFSNAAGALNLHGETGNDIYRHHAGSAANFVELAGQGTDSVQLARGVDYTLPANIENISVSGFSGSSLVAAATLNGNVLGNTINAHNNLDTLFGHDGNDRLFGKGDNDYLDGGNGNDYLDGGPGNDFLSGQAGNDILNGRAGDDTMLGGFDDDTYYVDSLGDIVTEDSGQGTDTVRVTTISNPSDGYFSYTLPANVENAILSGLDPTLVNGNGLDNLIIGTAQSDVIGGYAGNDTLKGGASNDNLFGGEGNDFLYGGGGDDYLQGVLGDDTYYIDDAGDYIDEIGGGGIDTVVTSLTSYTLSSSMVIENGRLTVAGNLTGNTLGNLLIGSRGADTLTGLAGNDTLVGGGGNDMLDAGHGNDSLIGGAGADMLNGGWDTNTFVYIATSDSSQATGVDEILDYSGTIKIDLSAIDANTSLAGDQAFAWANTTPTAYSVWIVNDAPGHYFVHADTNGNTTPDITIGVSGDLGSDSFIY